MASKQQIHPVEALLQLHAFLNRRKRGMNHDAWHRHKTEVMALTSLALQPNIAATANPEDVLKLSLEFCSSAGLHNQQIAEIVNKHNTSHLETSNAS